MDCDWIQEQLVALQDGELSPSATTLVVQHLPHCEACTLLEAALLEATPQPCLVVPAAIQAALEQRVNDALDEAFRHPIAAPPQPRTSSLLRWLRHDRDLTNGAMVAYAFLLAVTMGWGMSNYLALPNTHQQPVMAAIATPGATVPDEQYRPASWTDDGEADPWR